jgi:hypothetical protein
VPIHMAVGTVTTDGEIACCDYNKYDQSQLPAERQVRIPRTHSPGLRPVVALPSFHLPSLG